MDTVLESLRPVLREITARLERKYPYASAFLTHRREVMIAASSRDERVTERGPSVGAVFTVRNGSFFQEVSTGDISRDGLYKASREIESFGTAEVSRASEKRLERALIEKSFSGTLNYITPMSVDPATVSLEEKLDLCRRTRDRAAKLSPRVRDAQGTYFEERVQTLFIRPISDMAQELSRISFGFGDVVSDEGVVRHDGISVGGAGGFELAVIPEKKWEEVAQRIPFLLKATPIQPGYYDVVANPENAGVIAHEAFGHGVETDMFLKGRAKSMEYLGKPVGSELVNLYDDPTYPGGMATFGFDDEGQIASKTEILRRGIFVQGLTDLNSAMHLDIPRTANGRREGVNKVYPRMTNTYFAPGTDKLEDMIASIDRGFYLGGGASGMEDPKGWGIQCVVSWAREISKGRLTDRYHTNVGLTGYVPDLLQSVTMVGSDLRLSGDGYCGKGHKEFIRVGVGGPHMKMKARLG